MTEQRAAIVAEARARYGAIKPCAGKRRLEDCFTQEDCGLLFWFNTQDGNTRMMIEESGAGRSEAWRGEAGLGEARLTSYRSQ